MVLPRLIVTGASGFIGRHLLDAIKEEYQIFAMARRSQARSGAPVHPNITWFQVDIGDRAPLEAAFAAIQEGGGAEVLLHLAAHYDFTGEDHPEYYRTNIDGMQNVLDLARRIGIKHFVFSSSVAASRFPRPGSALNEQSDPDGEHVYAVTKRIGEEMLARYRHDLHGVIVRFAAAFSGWCEYPPLFMFLSTWLSTAWNRRILGGRGASAIPYIHVRDIVSFLRSVLDQVEDIPPLQVLIASPDGATSHRELFQAATRARYGRPSTPILMPKPLCGPGMYARDLLGRMIGERPFERPWMAKYIDLAMTVDARATRERLGWAPRERLLILNRMPFLVENRASDPLEWTRRNRAAMKAVRVEDNLRVHWLLQRHEAEIAAAYHEALMSEGPEGRFATYLRLFPSEDILWNQKVLMHQLMSAVRTGDRSVLSNYCADLAVRRYHEGFPAQEVCAALELINVLCLRVLRRDRESDGMQPLLRNYITKTLRYGCDGVQEAFERLEATRVRRERTGRSVIGRTDPGG